MCGKGARLMKSLQFDLRLKLRDRVQKALVKDVDDNVRDLVRRKTNNSTFPQPHNTFWDVLYCVKKELKQ